MKKSILIAALLTAAACSREEAVQQTREATQRVSETTSQVAQRIRDEFNPNVPVGADPTAEEIERQRLDAEWRRQQSFQARARARAGVQPPAGPADIRFQRVPKFAETLVNLDPASIDAIPVTVPIAGDVEGPSVLKTQTLLDRARFSVGAIDGRWGKNTEIAVYWFQEANGIRPTGVVDEATYRALVARAGRLPSLVQHTLTQDDVKGPFTKIPEDMYEKAKLDCLCYENVGEKLAERFHTTTGLLEKLNPNVQLLSLTAGQKIFVPNVRPATNEDVPDDVQKIVVSAEGWYVHGLDGNGNVVFHAPTTLGNEYDPSPNETLKIVGIARNPHFHYQPTLFAEVPDDEPEANLEPGPNSPVGLVWMALSKPHFGIHGTAVPHSIGYSSSHGCVRLTNWDALELANRVEKGVTVEFVDTRRGNKVASATSS
jgi:lipoprotein-anchoring transpeptidase ErfK/SrfK